MAILKGTNGLLNLGSVVSITGLSSGEVNLGLGRLSDGKGTEAGGGLGRALVGEAEAPLAVQLGAAVATSTSLRAAEAHHGAYIGRGEGAVLDPGTEAQLLDEGAKPREGGEEGGAVGTSGILNLGHDLLALGAVSGRGWRDGEALVTRGVAGVSYGAGEGLVLAAGGVGVGAAEGGSVGAEAAGLGTVALVRLGSGADTTGGTGAGGDAIGLRSTGDAAGSEGVVAFVGKGAVGGVALGLALGTAAVEALGTSVACLGALTGDLAVKSTGNMPVGTLTVGGTVVVTLVLGLALLAAACEQGGNLTGDDLLLLDREPIDANSDA